MNSKADKMRSVSPAAPASPPKSPNMLGSPKSQQQKSGRNSHHQKKVSFSALEKTSKLSAGVRDKPSGLPPRVGSKANLHTRNTKSEAAGPASQADFSLPSIQRSKLELSDILQEHERNRERKVRFNDKPGNRSLDHGNFTSIASEGPPAYSSVLPSIDHTRSSQRSSPKHKLSPKHRLSPSRS